MKADFSGYATKAGIKCTDGRTIAQDAFKHQDQQQVPLVWQHGHTDPENVLGHAILEHRPDGVYAYGFLNKTKKAQHAAELLEHGDINKLSIWANQLMERAGLVIHGAIREVSLVLAGANPGAVIESVTIRHADGDHILEDEAIIRVGSDIDEVKRPIEPTQQIVHATAADDDDEDDDMDEDMTVQDVYDSMNEAQKQVLHYMVGEALEQAKSSAEHSDLYKEGNEMQHTNVFDRTGRDTADTGRQTHVLSHDAMSGIVEDAKQRGSLKKAVTEYALSHGITDIDQLFPDARNVTDVPEWVSRRQEWVSKLLGKVRKSPVARIRTLSADLTEDAARAKGYIKGSLKKEEFFRVARRATTPTTIYKKQALDRDDIVDITDFNVVSWLKGEMRIMLDEELARAILLGDGRDISDPDKINEQNIRPIAFDHEVYTTVVTVNVNDSASSMNEVTDAFITNRHLIKGSGLPTFFTTEIWLAKWLLLRDGDGRRLYRNLQELALELRVDEIVPVEVMQEYPEIVGVMVNPMDYVLGADKGGEVNMFDDFDIDYNKEKYLIETRCSGALVKIKSALVIKTAASDDVLVAPTAPTFNSTTGVVTIPTQTGVIYKNAAGATLSSGAQSAISAGATTTVYAEADDGYYFATSEGDSWDFTRDA